MMETILDPNQEVESWKDAFYDEIKKVSTADLANQLEKKAKQILEQYDIKCTTVKIIRKQEPAVV